MGTSPLMCQQMLCGFCNICRHLFCWKQATLTNLKLLTLPNGKPIARLVKPLAVNSLLSKMEMMTWSHNQEKWEMNYLKEKNWKVRCNDTFLEAECKPMSNVQVCANDQKHYKYHGEMCSTYCQMLAPPRLVYFGCGSTQQKCHFD